VRRGSSGPGGQITDIQSQRNGVPQCLSAAWVVSAGHGHREPSPLDDCRRAGRPTCRMIRAYAEDAMLLGGPRDRLIDRGVIRASENQPGAFHVTINESAFCDGNTQRAQFR
jgi:hypothetical protein